MKGVKRGNRDAEEGNGLRAVEEGNGAGTGGESGETGKRRSGNGGVDGGGELEIDGVEEEVENVLNDLDVGSEGSEMGNGEMGK